MNEETRRTLNCGMEEANVEKARVKEGSYDTQNRDFTFTFFAFFLHFSSDVFTHVK